MSWQPNDVFVSPAFAGMPSVIFSEARKTQIQEKEQCEELV